MRFSVPALCGFSDVVDLSHPISEEMPLWPGDPATRVQTVADLSGDGYFLRSVTFGEHSGTHMNAPCSFHEDGAGIDEYGPGDLIREAVVIDVRQQAAANPDYAFGLRDLDQWERQHGEVPDRSVVLLSTGWDRYWNDPERFLGFDEGGSPHFPGFSGEATGFLLDERRIGGVGIDTHGVDPGQDRNYTTNRRVLAQPRIVLENLTNLDRLPATGSTIVIAPLKLKGGSGSPVTVFGLIP